MRKLLLGAGLALATLTAGAVVARPALPQGGCKAPDGVKEGGLISSRIALPCPKKDDGQRISESSSGQGVKAAGPPFNDPASSRPVASGHDSQRCHWKDEVYRDAYGNPVQRQVEVCH